MMVFRLMLFVSLGVFYNSYGLLNLLKLGEEPTTKSKISVSNTINEKQEQVALLQADLEELKGQHEERQRYTTKKIEEIDAVLASIKEQLKKASSSQIDFLTRQQTYLNETRQLLLNLQLASSQLIVPVEQSIIRLQDNINDVNFASLQLPDQSFFTYQDFARSSNKVLAHEEKIRLLQEQYRELEIEQDNLKQKLLSVSKEYDIKKREQKEFNTKAIQITGFELTDFSAKEQGILLDLQKNMYSYEKKLLKIHIDELKRKMALLSTTISVEQERLKVLKSNLEKVRRSLRIDPQDLQDAKKSLSEQKRESLALQETLYTTITDLVSQKEIISRRLDQAKKKYKNGEISTDWHITPKTAEQIQQLCDLGLYSEQLKQLESEIDYNNARIDLEKVKFNNEKITMDILLSWADLLKRKGKTADLNEEFKRYQSLLTENERKITTFKERRNTVSSMLALEHKTLGNIKRVIQDLSSYSGKLKNEEYAQCVEQLGATELSLNTRLETHNKIIQTYSDSIDTLTLTNHQLSNIISELEKKSIWQRSEYAISIAGIKNSLTDFDYFIRDVKTLLRVYTSRIHFSTLTEFINNSLFNGDVFLLWLSRITLLLVMLLFFRKIIWELSRWLGQRRSDGSRATSKWVMISSLIVEFIKLHYAGLFLFSALFVAIIFDLFDEPLFEIVCYLIAIPYFLYITHQLVKYIVEFNRNANYALFTQAYERRFKVVALIFGYASTLLLFMRESFISGMYYTSELPTILLASYSIIVRTLIIFSIGRDEIIHLLPSRGPFWQAFARIISYYYYPLLVITILLMILSDPYVGGYGNLVAYFFWGIVWSLILIKVLLVVQQYIKKAATHLFMYSDDEALRERFSHARSWYGIFVVLISCIFLLIGIILALYIWGQPINWYDIRKLLELELFTTGIEDGKRIWFTPQKFFVVLGFIISGFWSAVIINRFLITRIFQLLPVDLGIQHMVTSLTRYLVMMIAIFIGFQWAGLGTLLIAIGLVIGSIGYLVREPLADFLSYFIILVQRPVKIGDLVMIGEDLGFVRHITPRSVILRSKNSYTLIVPNSTVIAQSLKNWNYMRGYVAFDDIILTIPYAIDPVRVKEIIHEVLNSSHLLLKIPAPIIRLENFGENGYEFLIRGFVSSDKTPEIWDIASDIRLHLVQALRKHNIVIAIPTRAVVSLKSHKPQQHDEYSKMLYADDD